jgi:hypothetical protein
MNVGIRPQCGKQGSIRWRWQGDIDEWPAMVSQAGALFLHRACDRRPAEADREFSGSTMIALKIR